MNRIFTMKTSPSSHRSLLAAVVLFCLSVLSAAAQSVTQNHIKYTVTNSTKTAAVVGSDDKYIQHVAIADSITYNGQKYPVVTINSKAFQDHHNIRSIDFGSNLRKISTYAFSGCEYLNELIVPEGVETIENSAFQNCALRYVDLPSTLRSLGGSVFKTNSSQKLDTLVLRTAYYDNDRKMKVLPFYSSFFNNTIKTSCTLMVPKKAFDYYSFVTVDNDPTSMLNWGSFFTKIVPFGTAPSSCSVAPHDGLKDFRDLAGVALTFNFDEEGLADVMSMGPDDYIDAALLLPDGTTLSADAVELRDDRIYLDFAEVLQKNRELFIAPSEEVSTIDVRLLIDGQIQLEECPYMLSSFFAHHSINWSVPLLPSVYDLPQAPAVEPGGEQQAGGYDYKAFEAVTLKFDGYSGLSFDTNTGAYISARLYKDGQLLASSQTATVTGTNALTIPFNIPTDELLVRRTSGVESYDFMLEVEGQVTMTDGEEEKNFCFTLPLTSTSSPAVWKVLPLYIPEPTGVSFLPGGEHITLASLTDVAVSFEGVTTVTLATAAAPSAEGSTLLPLKARLFQAGTEVATLGADKVRAEGNTLHLLFDSIDERLVTLITSDEDYRYAFTMSLEADLITDGYPCRVVIGSDSSASGSGATTAPYTQHWASPCWSVVANVCDVPEVTVTVPVADEVTEYEQLRVVELAIENYKQVELLPTSSSQNAVGRLVRYGNPVCVVNTVRVEGNKIIIDFGEKLTYNAVGITPDDDPDLPVDLTLYFEADLLFDGLPYHLVYDGYKHQLLWSLKPVVVYKLPTPTIEHEQNRIYFTSGVEDVEYHYTITNADDVSTTTKVATKVLGGSRLTIPLQRRYTVSVYTTREGYEDSETATVLLELEEIPSVEVKE